MDVIEGPWAALDNLRAVLMNDDVTARAVDRAFLVTRVELLLVLDRDDEAELELAVRHLEQTLEIREGILSGIEDLDPSVPSPLLKLGRIVELCGFFGLLARRPGMNRGHPGP